MEYIFTNFMLYVREISKMWPYIFGNTFTFCTDIPFAVHFNCVEKNPTFTWRTSTHENCADFFLPFFKVQFVFLYNFMVFINTDAATPFLTLYWLLSPARNYLICNPCPPWGGGGRGDICCVQNHCFFLYMYVPLFFFYLYFIYLYRCYFLFSF